LHSSLCKFASCPILEMSILLAREVRINLPKSRLHRVPEKTLKIKLFEHAIYSSFRHAFRQTLRMQTHRYSLGSVISELRTLQSRTAGIYSFVQVEVRPLESACLRFEVLRICSCLLFNSTSLLSAQTMNAQQEGAYTYQQKVMLLKSRYKSSKDLWLFMTERCKYPLYFPAAKARVDEVPTSRSLVLHAC